MAIRTWFDGDKYSDGGYTKDFCNFIRIRSDVIDGILTISAIVNRARDENVPETIVANAIASALEHIRR